MLFKLGPFTQHKLGIKTVDDSALFHDFMDIDGALFAYTNMAEGITLPAEEAKAIGVKDLKPGLTIAAVVSYAKESWAGKAMKAWPLNSLPTKFTAMFHINPSTRVVAMSGIVASPTNPWTVVSIDGT